MVRIVGPEEEVALIRAMLDDCDETGACTYMHFQMAQNEYGINSIDGVDFVVQEEYMKL